VFGNEQQNFNKKKSGEFHISLSGYYLFMKADKGSSPLYFGEDIKHMQLNCTETSKWRN